MYAGEDSIIQLHDDDFDVKTNKVMYRGEPATGLLKVFAEWCGACARMKPIYASFSKGNQEIDTFAYKYNEENDHAAGPTLINKAIPGGLKGYPTILMIDGGKLQYDEKLS